MGQDALRILVCDDHGLFRAGLKHLLKPLADSVEIIEARNFHEALTRISETGDLDLLLVDLIMPDMEGFAGVKALRGRVPDAPLVVVSVKERAQDVRRAIEAGAAGYIPKASGPQVLLNALKLVLSGGMYLPPNLLQAGDQWSPDDDEDAYDGRPRIDALTNLTPRQRDVLALLARGKTNSEIADSLGLAAGTVKVHVSRILKALGVQNRTQAVIAAGSLLKAGGSAVRD